MVRSALVEMTKQHGRKPTAEPSPRGQPPALRPLSLAFENRPSGDGYMRVVAQGRGASSALMEWST